MNQVFIRRGSMSEAGTFGMIFEDKVPFAVTLEPPEKGNQVDISCIPEGSYICKRVDSPTYGDTFQITDVNGRGDILFHWGNWIRNTKGCVLIGTGFDVWEGEPVITRSKSAFKKFMLKMKDVDEFALTIQDLWAVI